MLPSATACDDHGHHYQYHTENAAQPSSYPSPRQLLSEDRHTIQQASRKRAVSENVLNEAHDSPIVRRRISRACDQCNSLRSRCDGEHPCTRCVENELPCAYERGHKKRGRVPRKGKVQGAEKKAGSSHLDGRMSTGGTGQVESNRAGATLVSMHRADLVPNTLQSDIPCLPPTQSTFYRGYDTMPTSEINISNPIVNMTSDGHPTNNAMPFGVGDSAVYESIGVDMLDYGFSLGNDYSIAFMGRAPMVDSPDWMAFASPIPVGDQWAAGTPRHPDTLRYPVLQAVMPQLEPIISPNLACDLLEQYFATLTTAGSEAKNPYILGCILRKASILHPSNPRPCTAALLASMLWISAQHSDAPFLTTRPDVRAQTCQKLLELTINMLKPLVHSHGTSGSPTHHRTTPLDASLGSLVLPIDMTARTMVSRKQVDNIITYIHLATVVSASERKAASLRWWNAAWSLAREIRLGRELPGEGVLDHGGTSERLTEEELVQNQRPLPCQQHTASLSASHPISAESRGATCPISEEEREERRRVWWLLYTMDRHLALCYNRPTFFLNKECEGLLQPMDDARFQSGDFNSQGHNEHPKGLDIECKSLSVYGFFLPLMVILGEILDLNHARNRPRFGPRAKRLRDFSEMIHEIEDQLETFGRSLHQVTTRQRQATMQARSTVPIMVFPGQEGGGHSMPPELETQTKVVVAYGTHIMHVLHILLTGKWDPIAMLDDNDLWISSQSFVTATNHAVSAAQALADIIDHDPDLSFMPYFFGIYLLQGSFLLLLFADKLQHDITPDVVQACEMIVRAHEACVSTLDTQYQRNFRRVMRSALRQLRGRMHEDVAEQQNWRREILKLYRWTGDGTGLAL